MYRRGLFIGLTFAALFLTGTVSVANAPDDPPKPPAVGGLAPPRPPAPFADVPNLGTDATVDASRKAILAALPFLRTQPAPFIKTALPDFAENARVIRFKNQSPEFEEPVPSGSRPALPPLPVK